MSEVDPFDSMMGGNFVRTARFDEVGDTHEGVIVDVTMEQARQYDPDNLGKGDLLYWSDKGKPTTVPNDKPLMEPRMIIQTDEREDDDDDGRRAITINKRLQKAALQKGVRAAGARKPEIGGWIRHTRGPDEAPLKAGGNKPRGWVIPYKTPAQYATEGALEATMAGKPDPEDDAFATPGK